MLTNAMDSKTKEPYDALVDDFGRTCASNRRANREIEQLRSDIQEPKEHCKKLEEVVANPVPCSLPHKTSAADQGLVAHLEDKLLRARQALGAERTLSKQLEDKASQFKYKARMHEDELAWTCLALEAKKAVVKKLTGGMAHVAAPVIATEIDSSNGSSSSTSVNNELIELKANFEALQCHANVLDQGMSNLACKLDMVTTPLSSNNNSWDGTLAANSTDTGSQYSSLQMRNSAAKNTRFVRFMHKLRRLAH
ncbi:hypothetical protein BX070DRAFT_234667 [Coemansia spiralis]|nr:hypothetical protein BX070DRAFT_234667 [Coemansia spiralis]